MKTYIMVWIEENERWDYYINLFNEEKYPKGYVDYYIYVDDNGKIFKDTWNYDNVGKYFIDCYDVKLWI